jgi:hypothetical protein
MGSYQICGFCLAERFNATWEKRLQIRRRQLLIRLKLTRGSMVGIELGSLPL